MTRLASHRVGWALILALLATFPAWAEIRVDAGTAPDTDTTALAQGLRSDLATLNPSTTLSVRVTVGVEAFRAAIQAADGQPIVATYLTSTDFYSELAGRARPPNITAVFSNPDPIDQLVLADSLLGKPAVGLFDSPAAHHLALRLSSTHAQPIPVSASQGIDDLLRASASLNALIALPDSALINRSNIAYVVRVLYQRNAALIGYSQVMVRAGALASVYVERTSMNARIHDLVALLAAGSSVPDPVFVRDIAVAVNEPLARSLNLSIPPLQMLVDHIKNARKERHP